ncbi:hypothetical protein CYMTET_48915 [Cymbomonas tetramitiformis]|uniref:Aminotransferase class I/classII large domain-containing protein n=1 Tax=Cymbomonas tetramitiformis TaxID=36881 RepID=A0AAE0BSI4_9CHLO|nr:hypothetical protein CYMTET_48915 [Cymbomonas tetramitiformis]
MLCIFLSSLKTAHKEAERKVIAQCLLKLMNSWNTWLINSLHDLENKHLVRSLRTIHCSRQGQHHQSSIEIFVSHAVLRAWIADASSVGSEDGAALFSVGVEEDVSTLQRIVLFSTNDYLGLSAHPKIKHAMASAATSEGMGPRSSPLIAGYTQHHRALETKLAALKGTEDCLLYPSGFAANIAVITSLCIRQKDEEPAAIFSDELNHASIVDGCKLAKSTSSATIYIYRHNDMRHLEQLLSKSTVKRKLVVTDSLFSMDGDVAPLRALSRLKQQHGFLLAVDEAHGTLVQNTNPLNFSSACKQFADIP